MRIQLQSVFRSVSQSMLGSLQCLEGGSLSDSPQWALGHWLDGDFNWTVVGHTYIRLIKSTCSR